MINIIVLFPKLEQAKSIRNLLVRNGFDVTATCTTGAQAIQNIDNLDQGIVICGYQFADMLYSELRQYLPSTFEMLLVASKNHWVDCRENDIVCLSMPLKVQDLIDSVHLLFRTVEIKRKKRKQNPKERTEEEKAVIYSAKCMLMEQKGFSAEEAHKYLQKKSMDSGRGMVETAQMVLDIF